MFYIKEIYFRLLFINFLVFILFFIYYNYKEITLVIFLIPSKFMGCGVIEHFIYTDPTELIYAFLNLNAFFIFISLVPYILWVLLDFLKTAMFLSEYHKTATYLYRISTIIILLNLSLFTIFFPLIFRFFQSFNISESSDIYIKFELKIIEFIYFIYNVLYIINIGLFTITILVIIIITKGIVYYLKYKKFFILFNIVTATILSTPEISSQIFFFIVLNMSLEILQFIISLMTKFNKVTC